MGLTRIVFWGWVAAGDCPCSAWFLLVAGDGENRGLVSGVQFKVAVRNLVALFLGSGSALPASGFIHQLEERNHRENCRGNHPQ